MINFDSRMNDETKRYIQHTLQELTLIDANCSNLSEMRALQERIDRKKNKSFKRFKRVIEREYIVTNTEDGYKIPVSAYIPQRAKPNAPIVLFIHGGGWRLLNGSTYHRSLSYIADSSNTIWLSVEYRRSPEYKYPTALTDCYSVLKWVSENKVRLFGSSKNCSVGICGDSAGGNLAASVTHMFKDLLNFHILIYPFLDLTMSSESYKEFNDPCYIITPSVLGTSVAAYLDTQEQLWFPSVSPLFYDKNSFKGLPECLIINAEMDPVVDDGCRYHDKLCEAGVSSELQIIDGAIHGFFHAYNEYENIFLDAAHLIINFLKKFFK